TLHVSTLSLHDALPICTYRILMEHREFYQKTQNVDIVVESVLELNRERALALGVPEDKIASNIAEIVSNPDVNIVVEVIGGISRSEEHTSELQSRFDLV